MVEFLVEKVLSQSRSCTFQFGDHVRQFLDRVDLLLKEVVLQEISKLGVIVISSNSVKIQKGLKIIKKLLKTLYTNISVCLIFSIIQRQLHILPDSRFFRVPKQQSLLLTGRTTRHELASRFAEGQYDLHADSGISWTFQRVPVLHQMPSWNTWRNQAWQHPHGQSSRPGKIQKMSKRLISRNHCTACLHHVLLHNKLFTVFQTSRHTILATFVVSQNDATYSMRMRTSNAVIFCRQRMYFFTSWMWMVGGHCCGNVTTLWCIIFLVTAILPVALIFI